MFRLVIRIMPWAIVLFGPLQMLAAVSAPRTDAPGIFALGTLLTIVGAYWLRRRFRSSRITGIVRIGGNRSQKHDADSVQSVLGNVFRESFKSQFESGLSVIIEDARKAGKPLSEDEISALRDAAYSGMEAGMSEGIERAVASEVDRAMNAK